MALTLEELQAQRARILSGMGGVQQVQFGDRSVTNRSQADLEAALARIDNEIALASGPRPRQIVIVPKGL